MFSLSLSLKKDRINSNCEKVETSFLDVQGQLTPLSTGCQIFYAYPQKRRHRCHIRRSWEFLYPQSSQWSDLAEIPTHPSFYTCIYQMDRIKR